MTRDTLGVIAGTLALLGIVSFAFWLMASTDHTAIVEGSKLPPNASNIESLGKGWYEFDYKGSRYLYHATGIGDQARESLVKIGPAKDE